MEKLVRKKRLLWFAIVPMLLFCGVATAQYPILDEVAARVIQKYQGASCEELWREKYAPKPERERGPGRHEVRQIPPGRDVPQSETG